jgi:hypothetical protein
MIVVRPTKTLFQTSKLIAGAFRAEVRHAIGGLSVG